MLVSVRNDTNAASNNPSSHRSHWRQGCRFTGSSLSSVGKESRNLISGNRAFANDTPARSFVGEINDGGSDIARRRATVDDNADASLQLVAYLLGAGTLRGAAKIGRCGGDWNGGGGDHRQGNLGVRHAQSDVAGISGHLQGQA